ncbi:MAG: hypothetical protein NC307_00895 [Roseburia sp.]|nr:hypothetical protein [Roseburia sp.]
MTKKAADKICNWIQIIGLMGFVFLLMFCFFGKEDDYLEKTAFFGMVAGIVAYVLSLLLSSDLKGIGLLFLLLGGIYVGTNVFLSTKGYGTGEVSDCGAYTFQADRYWQETRTTRVRHRTTKHYVSYVEYQAVLENGDEVTYEVTTASIGDAMELVKRRDKKERQIFFYNQGYYTDEPGTGEQEFLSGFLKWKKILYGAAAGYAVAGGIFLLLGERIDFEEDENEMSTTTIIR